MTTRISNVHAGFWPHRLPASAAAHASRTAKTRFPKDEMSTGRSLAHRAAQVLGGSPASRDVAQAFDARIAALERAVSRGVQGARSELAAVRRDRDGVQAALADLEAKLARATQPGARAQLHKQLRDLASFGVTVAHMNATERQNLQNFFRHVSQAPAPTGTPANIQAAIDFGLSQLGAPYVGGASPFRFGTPGDGRTYQMAGQRAYVSPKGVIGYDCSGFVVTVLRKAGIDLGRMASSSAMKASLPQVPKSELKPGDLLVKNGHVAMFIGNGQMIESVPGGVRVAAASTYINDPAYTGHRPG